jgi:DNA-binding response OmpR family regulator
MSEIQALIVDDDPKFQQLTQYELMSHGMNVLVAYNSSQADVILKHEKVDVIICDVLMENEDGLSYCNRLRDEGHKQPVIFLSSLNDPKTIRLGYEAGGSIYIVKPFVFDDLHERIMELVNPPASTSYDPSAENHLHWLIRLFRAAFID